MLLLGFGIGKLGLRGWIIPENRDYPGDIPSRFFFEKPEAAGFGTRDPDWTGL
jgi:hypothetical protein